MTDYTELIKMLRTCSERDSCVGWDKGCPYLGTGLCDDKAGKAADAIEDLTDFAHYVAREVVRDDDDWEDNRHYAFQEIACRKLVKLGIVDSIGDEYRYEPKEETE